MRLPKIVACLCAAAAIAMIFAPAKSADAQYSLSYFTKTYKVQVEYWFWDSDHYYWSTVFESDEADEAQFVYNILMLAKANGQLNQAAPNSNWKYFAVDVRMITVCQFPDTRYQAWKSDLWWYSRSNIFRR